MNTSESDLLLTSIAKYRAAEISEVEFQSSIESITRMLTELEYLKVRESLEQAAADLESIIYTDSKNEQRTKFLEVIVKIEQILNRLGRHITMN
jgi:hypothetical protein